MREKQTRTKHIEETTFKVIKNYCYPTQIEKFDREEKRWSEMPRKKTKHSNIEDHNGIRISYHEKVCAERMKTLFKAIEDMRKDVKDLRNDMSKGKGAINILII